MKLGSESLPGSALFPAPPFQTTHAGELFRAWTVFRDGLCHSGGMPRNKAGTDIHVLVHSLK